MDDKLKPKLKRFGIVMECAASFRNKMTKHKLPVEVVINGDIISITVDVSEEYT